MHLIHSTCPVVPVFNTTDVKQ